MRAICKCKNVKYCDEDCLRKDLRFHKPNCSAEADAELGDDEFDTMSKNSRQGVVGLSNLGNTCYMNSSI